MREEMSNEGVNVEKRCTWLSSARARCGTWLACSPSYACMPRAAVLEVFRAKELRIQLFILVRLRCGVVVHSDVRWPTHILCDGVPPSSLCMRRSS